MVKGVGFICEGETEKIIVESDAFQHLLQSQNLSCVKVIDAAGNGNLLPKNIQNHILTMQRYEAERVIILTDLDEEVCITLTKERIQKDIPANAIIVVSVKALESWYLADSSTLSAIFGKEFSFDKPESVTGKPIDTINQIFRENTGRGIGKSAVKTRLAKYMVKMGFNIQNSAQHPNCPSAKYFIDKLAAISAE